MSIHHQRRQRLRRQHKIPRQVALLVTNLINVKYLTGFSGSSGWLLITANDELLISDTRYETQLAEECPDLKCEIRTASETQLQTLAGVVKKLKYQAIQYESETLTKATFDALEEKLEGVDLISTQQIVEQLRAIKDATEIEAIRKSIQINQRVFEIIKNQLTPDQTELEIAHELESQMRRFGASGVAFDPIVAVGDRSALPHAHPSGHRVGESPILLVDWGTKFGGYASDLTRVLVTGKVPSKFRKIYDTVLAAQRAAVETIRPGVSFKSVDEAARNVIEKAGYGKFFGHGLGHGFGLEIHESPSLNPISEGELAVGMVVTVEPGIYLPGFAGVRIEDDVLVTHNGSQLLSDLPREFEECCVSLI